MENKKEYCAICGKEINQDNWGVDMCGAVFCANSCAVKIFTKYCKEKYEKSSKSLDKSNQM